MHIHMAVALPPSEDAVKLCTHEIWELEFISRILDRTLFKFNFLIAFHLASRLDEGSVRQWCFGHDIAGDLLFQSLLFS